MNNLYFEYPWVLYAELLLLPLLALYLWREWKQRRPSLMVATTLPFLHQRGQWKRFLRHIPFALRLLALAALIAAVARPRSSSTFQQVDTEGIDIVLAMDISTSMLARDFVPDRIGAAKDIAIQFIAERPSDRIGLVVFAGESFTQSPLTTDRATLINLMKEVECGLIEDGTAIGNGLATAVSRLKDSDAPSRVVILLTDGVNNRGEITPQMAAEIAQTYGVRVYTIGVGKRGQAPYPVVTPFGVQVTQVAVEIDEDLLRQLAEQTGGTYFRATDNTKLREIYAQINEMEKSRTTVDSFPIYEEYFMKFAWIALAALLLEVITRFMLARRMV
ncbi:MAG: VWA domain-containing protein [Bacteroidales bacterium]|nr:VWA domain-containing protein [Bacteroidales bacterium]